MKEPCTLQRRSSLAALRGDKDQEGQPCAPVPFSRQLKTNCKLTTRLLQFKYVPTCCSEARGCYHSARFCVPYANWAGRTEGQRTANVFIRQTKRNTLNGLVLTFMTILRMFSGQMNHLQCHKRFCSRKKGEQPHPKPRAKHPIKVHVWAGIGWHGATEICIFHGIMDAAMYIRILQVALLPTLQRQEYEKVTGQRSKTYLKSGKRLFC